MRWSMMVAAGSLLMSVWSGSSRPADAAPTAATQLSVVVTAAAGALPSQSQSGPTSVAPGTSYTVTSTGCGTGWSVAVLAETYRYPATPIRDPNPTVGVAQTDGGVVITRSVPSDVAGSPRHHQNYIVGYSESLTIRCTLGAEVAEGFTNVFVEPVDDFVRWQWLFAPQVTYGWQIQAIACSPGTTATLDVTSAAFTGQVTATIGDDRIVRFTGDQTPWLALLSDPDSVFVVSCTGADGARSITLTSNATAATPSPGAPGTLPGTGGSSPSWIVALGALLLMAGAVMWASARRFDSRT